MVIVGVVEFLVLEGIELNSEDMVTGAAIIREIEKPQILGGAGAVDSSRGCEEKGETMAGEEIPIRNDGEDEGGGEGKRRTGETDRDFRRVEGTADGEGGVLGENKNRGFDCGVAKKQNFSGSEIGVEDEVCGGN